MKTKIHNIATPIMGIGILATLAAVTTLGLTKWALSKNPMPTENRLKLETKTEKATIIIGVITTISVIAFYATKK